MRALLEGTLKYSLVLGFFFSPSDSLPGSILCCEHFAHQLAVPLRATVRRGRVTHADMKACTDSVHMFVFRSSLTIWTSHFHSMLEGLHLF